MKILLCGLLITLLSNVNVNNFNNEIELQSCFSDIKEESISDREPEANGSNYNFQQIIGPYGVPSDANIVHLDINTRAITFENFDESSYINRNESSSDITLTIEKYKSFEITNEYLISSNNITNLESGISQASIIDTDERTLVNTPKSWPYRGVAYIKMTYNNIYNNVKNKYENCCFIGTGFMEGPNLLVTAAHCAYSDVTSGTYHEDNVSNPRFPDKIEVYAGFDGDNDTQNNSYKYYAEVSTISIQKEYYLSPSTDYDWSAFTLNWNLGNEIGWYGKISNWYESNANVYSYGYPSDKSNTMWETHGNLISYSTYCYQYNFDTYGGQSGSPIFMTTNDGSTYVCGIHTYGGSSENGGTRINSFIFHYLNSYVSSYS